MLKTLLYVLAFIALGLITASLGPTLPALAEHTHTTTGQISWLFVTRALGTITGALVLGKLYDRMAGHPLLGGALVAAAALFALVPNAHWLGAVAALFALVGLTLALINVGGNMLIVLVHGARVGPYLSLIHFAYGAGGLLAPLVVKPFAARVDALWWMYLMLAVLIAPAGLLLFGAKSPAVTSHTPQQTGQAVLSRPVVLLLLFFFLEVGAEGAISGWLFTYARTQMTNEESAFFVNSAFWAAFTIGRLLSIPLALRFSEQRMITAHLLAWLGLSALALVLPKATAVWLLAIGSGLGMAPVFPLGLAWTQRTLHLSGKMTGWILVATASGAMTLPWVIGQLFEGFGAQVLPWLVSLDLAAAGLVWAVMLRQSAASSAAGTSIKEFEASVYEP